MSVSVCVCAGAEPAGDAAAAWSHTEGAWLSGGRVQSEFSRLCGGRGLCPVSRCLPRNCPTQSSRWTTCQRELSARTDTAMCCLVSCHDNR